MKKGFSIFLSVIIIALSVTPAFAAMPDDTPVIFVPGFLQSYMYIDGEDGAEDEYLWLPMKEKIFQRIIDDFPNFIRSLIGLMFGDVEGFGETLGGGAYAVAEKMRCNPDGTSVYPVIHYNNDPAESNAANLKKIVSDDAERKNILFEKFIDYAVENNYAKAENIFIFEYDSRFDSITLADSLREFIKEVKEYTGSDKVNLFTISYGGLITATYLYYYQNEGDVGKAVLNVPPLEGTDFPERLFYQDIDLPLYTLVDFVESVLGAGTTIADIFAETDGNFLDTLMGGASGGMLEVVKYWGSIYCMSTPECYEDMKKGFLDSKENAAIIEKNDIIHYEIMPAMKNTFARCRANGIDVSIITCTGSGIVLGGDLNGDILVPTCSASGAAVAKKGERFPDGYTPLKTSCNNPEHNHVSPSMEIDASSAFLPENTWFIEDSYHAQFELEDYAMSLCAKLVFTDELADVHADPAYPQFEYSNNPHMGIHAKFNRSSTGYVSSEDTSLIIENVYGKNAVKILSVKLNGTEIEFDALGSKLLKPGESVEIAFSGAVPQVNATRSELVIEYIKLGVISGVATKTFEYTINNA